MIVGLNFFSKGRLWIECPQGTVEGWRTCQCEARRGIFYDIQHKSSALQLQDPAPWNKAMARARQKGTYLMDPTDICPESSLLQYHTAPLATGARQLCPIYILWSLCHQTAPLERYVPTSPRRAPATIGPTAGPRRGGVFRRGRQYAGDDTLLRVRTPEVSSHPPQSVRF